jgi:cysteine desulfurase
MRSDDPVYLDHNATTPLLPEVVDAMLPYLREHFGNPSSGHVYGRRAKEAVEHARAEVAMLLGCAADEVLFTSGGTEANNLALHGVLEGLREGPSERCGVVTTTVEHPATLAPLAWLAQRDVRVTRLAVDGACCVSLDAAAKAIGPETALVSVMHANNETGALQPIRALADLAHQAGAVMHTDAAQSVGKVRTHVDELAVDLLSLAGHKLYAPKGVGALYVRRGTSLRPFVRGAGHERGLRPGTENVASIVGLGVACRVLHADLGRAAERVRGLRERLWEQLAAAVPGLARSGPLDGTLPNTLPNTLHVRFPRVSGTALLAAAPDVAASTGSACHDGHETASAVLLAMGLCPEEALGAVRLTLGRGTTEDDVERAALALVTAYRELAAAQVPDGDSRP